LSVINPVTPTHHHLRSKLERKAEARLNVVPVGCVIGALAGIDKNLATLQWNIHRLTRDRIVVANAARIQWTRGIRIKPILTVVAFGARLRNVVAQT
jgi:hypothetical protein